MAALRSTSPFSTRVPCEQLRLMLADGTGTRAASSTTRPYLENEDGFWAELVGQPPAALAAGS